MNKNTFYRILIAVLLLTNLSLIGFIFLRKPQHPSPKHFIIQKLSFDKEQIENYEKLIKTHQDGILQLELRMKALKNELYALLSKKEASPPNDSIISELGKTQIEIEELNYQHFSEIKKLCRKEQIQAFETLTGELVKLFFRGEIKKRK